MTQSALNRTNYPFLARVIVAFLVSLIGLYTHQSFERRIKLNLRNSSTAQQVLDMGTRLAHIGLTAVAIVYIGSTKKTSCRIWVFI